MPDEMLTFQQVQERLHISRRALNESLGHGYLPGAVLATEYGTMGRFGRKRWLIPAGVLEGVHRGENGKFNWPGKPSPFQRDPRSPGLDKARCDLCGILLEESGDKLHRTPAGQSARCWFCIESYGDRKAQEIMAEIAARCEKVAQESRTQGQGHAAGAV